MHSSNHLIRKDVFLSRIFSGDKLFAPAHDIIAGQLFKPRKDVDAFSLKGIIDWEQINRRQDRNWRMLLQGWTMFHPAIIFFDDYKDKQGIIKFFFDCLQSWWQSYGSNPDDLVTSRMPESYAWYDMSTGFRALILSFMKNRIDYFHLNISKDQSELLRSAARKHINHLSTEKCFSLNNHGIFQAHGLMALSKTFKPDDSKDIESYAMSLFERLLLNQFDNYGIHREHSPGYHFYVLDSFIAAAKSCWYTQSSNIATTLKRAQSVTKWLVDPSKKVFCIGDSTAAVRKEVKFPSCSQKSCPYVYSRFSESGYAVVRSKWSQPAEQSSNLFVSGAYFSKTHKHRDCLSFELYEKGQRLIRDAGKYGYKSSKMRSSFLSMAAHNSVEIEGFDILKCRPYGSSIQKVSQLPGVDVFLIECGFSYPAISHRRKFYYSPGKYLLLVDSLSFQRARSAIQWFHFDRDLRVKCLVNNSVSLIGPNGQHVLLSCLRETANTDLFIGDYDGLKGLVSTSDYQVDESVQVGFKDFGKNLEFTTLLQVSPRSDVSESQFIADIECDLGIAIKGSSNISPPSQSFYVPRKASVSSEVSKKIFIPNMPHWCSSLEDLCLYPGKATYEISMPVGDSIYFFLDLKKNADKCLVLFPGATSRKHGVYDFQRYSWSDDFPGMNLLSFSDPSIRESNDIAIGWFQNSLDYYGIDMASRCIEHVLWQLSMDEKNLIFFGSSAGGFSALKMGERFSNSLAIALNPQLFLWNYHAQPYKEMVKACYPKVGLSQFRRLRVNRFQLVPRLFPRSAPTVILQNKSDTHHVTKHLKPFIDSFSSVCEIALGDIPYAVNSRCFSVLFFDDPRAGHSPPNRKKTVAWLNEIMASLGCSL